MASFKSIVLSLCLVALGTGFGPGCKKVDYADSSTSAGSDATRTGADSNSGLLPGTNPETPAGTDAKAAEEAAAAALKTASDGYGEVVSKLVGDGQTFTGLDYKALYADSDLRGKLKAFIDFAASTPFPFVGNIAEEAAFLVNVRNGLLISNVLALMQAANGAPPKTVWAPIKSGAKVIGSKLLPFTVTIKSWPSIRDRDALDGKAEKTVAEAVDQSGLKYFAFYSAAKDRVPLAAEPYAADILEDQLMKQLARFTGKIKEPVAADKKLTIPSFLSRIRGYLVSSVDASIDPKFRFAEFLADHLPAEKSAIADKIRAFEDKNIVPVSDKIDFGLDIKAETVQSAPTPAKPPKKPGPRSPVSLDAGTESPSSTDVPVDDTNEASDETS